MSLVKRIVDETARTILQKTRKNVEDRLSCLQAETFEELSGSLTSSHLSSIRPFMGKFADNIQVQIINEVIAACSSHFCKIVLSEAGSYHECLRACYRQFSLSHDTPSSARCLDEMQAEIHILEKDVTDRDEIILRKNQEITELKAQLAKAAVTSSATVNPLTTSQALPQARKRKSNRTIKTLEESNVTQFCRTALYDFTRSQIWKHVARPQKNRPSSKIIKFDIAVINFIYEAKKKFSEKPIHDLDGFRTDFVVIFKQCAAKFHYPTICVGDKKISILDIVDEFDRFWNTRKIAGKQEQGEGEHVVDKKAEEGSKDEVETETDNDDERLTKQIRLAATHVPDKHTRKCNGDATVTSTASVLQDLCTDKEMDKELDKELDNAFNECMESDSE